MRHPSFLAIGAFCALVLLGVTNAAAQPARPERADLPPNTIALTAELDGETMALYPLTAR